MKIKFMVAATLMAALVTTTSCGNSNKQSQSEKKIGRASCRERV